MTNCGKGGTVGERHEMTQSQGGGGEKGNSSEEAEVTVDRGPAKAL